MDGFNWERELEDLEDSPDDQAKLLGDVFMNIMLNFFPYSDKTLKPKEPPCITQGSKNLYNSYKRKYKKFARKGLSPC